MSRRVAMSRRTCRGSSTLVKFACVTAFAWAVGAKAGQPSSSPDSPPSAKLRNAAAAQPTLTPKARLLATARLWAAKRRDDLALQAVQKALLIAPEDSELLSEAVRIDLRLGDARGAAVALGRLKTLEPNAETTLQLDDEYRAATNGREELATIRLLARSGHGEQATQRLRALFPHGAPPGALGAEYYQILSTTPAGYAQAVDGLRQRVASDSSDSAAALALVALLNQRSATRAEANRLAWALAERKDVDHTEAMNAWRSVLQSAGEDPAYLDAVHAYLTFEPDDDEFKDRAATLDAQRQARLKLERDPAYIAQQQGLRALSRGDVPAADALLSRATKVRGSDADAIGGLGLVRLREGRHDEARALFQRAAALAPDNRSKWDGLARTALVWGLIAKGREAAAAGHAQEAQQAAQRALEMDPGNAPAKQLLADALLAQRNWTAAEPLLRELLASRQLNVNAAESMQALLRETGRESQIPGLLDALSQRFRDPADRAGLAGLRADLLTREAQHLASAGKLGPAAEHYEKALRLAPDAPWTRFALARIYRELGLPQLGRAVMDDGLASANASSEMRYAAALYRSSIDDLAGAQTALAGIAPEARTEGMRALAGRLDAQQALQHARIAFASGDIDAADRALDEARAKGGDDPYITASIGALLIDEGQPDRGLALMRDWMSRHPRETDADVRLRYGDLLGSAERDEDLAAWLANVRREPDLTQQQTARLEDQSLRLALRQTDAALDEKDFAQARRRLAQVSPAGKRDKRYALELADVERAQGHFGAARAALAPVLERSPQDPDARLALARVLEDSGQREAALRIVREVLEAASPDDIDTRLSAARRLAALRRPQEAAQVADALQAAYPTRSDVTIESGRVAEALGDYDRAAALYRRSLAQERTAGVVARGPDGTPAQAALFDLEQRRDPEIETGWMPAFKAGDPGISDYHAQQVPIYAQVPYRYEGHLFVHLDAVNLDAGTLSLTNPPGYALQRFGTYSAFASLPDTTFVLHQHASGVAIGTGFVSDAWRFDIGTTPLGFPVHYLVGGVRYRFDAGPASFSVSASRRPETSSELSYAGLRDPWTNAVWGGVRRDGVDWHTGIDVGRVSFFSELGAGMLTGKHVASNEEVTLRAGFMAPVYEGRNMRVSTGLVGNAWHYTNNLRFYSYGQGGYYSPQRYFSLGVPIEWIGRRGGLTWDLTATVGMSYSYEKDSPFYPDGLPAAVQPAAQNLGNAIYPGGSSGIGFSYGLSGVVQYRFNPRWVAGLRVDIDHAHDYAPSSGMVYLRYSFDARKPDTSLSPRPVSLYSSY